MATWEIPSRQPGLLFTPLEGAILSKSDSDSLKINSFQMSMSASEASAEASEPHCNDRLQKQLKVPELRRQRGTADASGAVFDACKESIFQASEWG